MLGGKLPVDADGTLTMPRIPTREYVGLFLDHWKISEEQLCEHFTHMLQGFLSGLASGDEAAVRGMTESNFAEKILT